MHTCGVKHVEINNAKLNSPLYKTHFTPFKKWLIQMNLEKGCLHTYSF